ncbi:hypothetical protein JTB14_037898 [Gonioctena quinquepunctata]|nr:hypothetical protein JTB14_037898 [Gonioctena quinquepunctata]
MRGRTKKWTIRAIYHFFDFAVAACWLEYRQNASTEGLRGKDTLDYLVFKLSVAQYLILTKKPSEQSEGNSEQSECEEEETPLKQRKVQPVPDKRVRTVGDIHLPVFTKQEQKKGSKCRFPKCGAKKVEGIHVAELKNATIHDYLAGKFKNSDVL